MFEIQTGTRDDEMAEALTVVKDGQQIGRITLQYDCPEDSTVNRLGLRGFARGLLMAAGVRDDQIAETDGEY